MSQIFTSLAQVKENLHRRLAVLPVNDAYSLLDRIIQKDFIKPIRFTSLTSYEIRALGYKPMTDELAQKIMQANSNKEKLEPLLREHIQLIFEYRCKWIDYLFGVTDKKPVNIPDPM